VKKSDVLTWLASFTFGPPSYNAQWQGHRDGGKLILDTYSHVRPADSAQMARLMQAELPALETKSDQS
jgi:hypothetical protein